MIRNCKQNQFAFNSFFAKMNRKSEKGEFGNEYFGSKWYTEDIH